jgi:hypothetical protein
MAKTGVACTKLLGGMVWVITKNLEADNFHLLCIHVELAALAPDNTALGKPPLKL